MLELVGCLSNNVSLTKILKGPNMNRDIKIAMFTFPNPLKLVRFPLWGSVDCNVLPTTPFSLSLFSFYFFFLWCAYGNILRLMSGWERYKGLRVTKGRWLDGQDMLTATSPFPRRPGRVCMCAQDFACKYWLQSPSGWRLWTVALAVTSLLTCHKAEKGAGALKSHRREQAIYIVWDCRLPVVV